MFALCPVKIFFNARSEAESRSDEMKEDFRALMWISFLRPHFNAVAAAANNLRGQSFYGILPILFFAVRNLSRPLDF